MGEAKQRAEARKRAIGSSAAPDLRAEALAELARTLTDQGLLIESGFALLRKAAIPPEASAVQVSEMRDAFFAGAQHLFGTLTGGGLLDDDAEPTEQDMQRMQKIHDELRDFIEAYKLRMARPQGQA
jgi:hypothetical protein